MKFGVVVCPRCKKALGIDLSCKTTTCPRCGKRFKHKDLRVFYRTSSEQELQQAIGQINAQLDGKLAEFRSSFRQHDQDKYETENTMEVRASIASRVKHVSGWHDKVEFVAQELDKVKSVFTVEDVKAVFEQAGLNTEKIESALQDLVDEAVVYEPQPGEFRIV